MEMLKLSSCTQTEKSQIIKSIFISPSSKNIRICVLRNYSDLPESTLGGDVDLLVHPDDKLEWIKHLEDVAASFNLELGVIQAHYHGIRFCIFGLGCNFFIKLDVHYGEYWRGVQYFDAETILKNCIKHKQINIPCQVNEAILSLLDPLITGGRPKEKYIRFIAKTVSQKREAVLEKLRFIVGRPTGNRIVEVIEQGRFEELSSFVLKVRVNLWGRMFLNSYGRCLPTIYEYLKYETNRRLHPIGVLVVLSGAQDGIRIFLNAFNTITKDRFPGLNVSVKSVSTKHGVGESAFSDILNLVASYNIVICSSGNSCLRDRIIQRCEKFEVEILDGQVKLNGLVYGLDETIDYIYRCVMDNYVMKYQSLRSQI